MEMAKYTLTILAMFTVVVSKHSSCRKKCSKSMIDSGLDNNFGEVVAHRIHSLTLEDLRYYFKDDAPVENGIPTVNPDLTPNVTRVLANAPESGYDMSFKTIALRHTDKVLSKIGREDWGITHYSDLEKLVHAHHMAEMWERSKTYYENFLKSPPLEDVCSCVNNIKMNGVMAELQLLALKIKFPALTSGIKDLPYGKNRHLSSDGKNARNRRAYTFRTYAEWSKKAAGRWDVLKSNKQKLYNFDFSGDEDDVVDRVMNELQDGDEGLATHLTDDNGWNIWREGLTQMDHYDNRQFAMFIYCMLNK